ncbi:MAG: hypothetical protein WA659_05455 [Candidatus Aquirickettsiella sp.]
MNAKKLIKSGFAWVLSGTQVVFDGLSSARQIVDFTSSPWAKYAACGATIVEGEIYRKNIVEGFSRFSLLNEKFLKEYLIIERFEENSISIQQYEKEIKNNLYDFLVDIDNRYKLNEPDENESKFLIKYKELLKNENHSVDAKNLQEIKEYFSNFKTKRNRTQSYISDDELKFSILEKNLKKIIFLKTSSFVASYIANQQFLEKTNLSHEKGSVVEEAEARLKLLRKLLIKSAVESGSCDLLNNEANLSADFINELNEEVSEKAAKLWPLRFGMLFSLGVGAAVGVITYYTFPAVLMGFGLTSLTILSAVIWPLAILAAISYAILIYNTITDLILNETLSKWWKKLSTEIDQNYPIKPNILKYICLVIAKSLSHFFGKLINWFKFQEQESYFSYALRMVLSAAVLVFGIIAALTTGYTAFIQLQNYVSLSVCVITALPLMLSDLLFTLKNSFETVSLLTGVSMDNLLNSVKNSYRNFTQQVSTENYLQCLLHIFRIPLKFMLSVLKLLIFCFHVFFTSVASDRFFNFPCWLTVFFAAGSELLTDICPLFGNKQGDHHDHDHGGIFNWIGKIIFIIPATILGILNCLFSQISRFTNSDTSALGFKTAIKREWQQFDIIHEHEHLVDDRNSLNEADRKLPKEIVLQKAVHICKKQIVRLEKGFFKTDLAKEKIKIFINYQQQLLQNNQADPNNNELQNNEKMILGKHRFFKREKTESMRKINKIEALIRPYMVNDNNCGLNGHVRAL